MAAIRKHGNKWQARIRINGHSQVSKSFTSKADAEAWGKVTESEMIRGVYIRRTEGELTTLAEAIVRYEKEVTPTKRGAEIELYRTKAWKASKLGKQTLNSLRGHDFAKWRDQRLTEASPATVRLELAVISNLYNIAKKEWGYEGLMNPIKAIRLPSVSNARSRLFYDAEEPLLFAALNPVERDEKGRLGEGCGNPLLKPLIMFALETAMRRGEMLALRWENIRMVDQVAHLPMTKNGSTRNVPLSIKAVEILKSLPKALRGAVFPVTANAVKLAFIRAVVRARKMYEESGGTDDMMLTDFHFHDLRHIAVTRLAEKLPNIVELASVSGHQDVRMLKRYYHPKAEDLAKKLG